MLGPCVDLSRDYRIESYLVNIYIFLLFLMINVS
jgi:hypothetical protein